MITVASFAPSAADATVLDGVLRLLHEVDAEFVPPLSERADTLALPRSSEPRHAEGDLGRYVDAVRRESWLVALDQRRVVGLVSFIDDPGDHRLAAGCPSLYATTVAVTSDARRTGVCHRLYDELEATARQRAVPCLTTRTWTTNAEHLALLDKRGFRSIAVIPGDRGSGIGTVHLAYRLPGTGGGPCSPTPPTTGR